MKIEVRNATLEELDTLLAWRMQVLSEVFSFPKAADCIALRTKNEAYYKEHLAKGSHTACFALNGDNGQIVGCGGICYQAEMPSPDNPSGQNGYLMNIYTLPEFRGKGIGRKIVAFLIADARRKGTGKIYLESSRSAKNLYHKIGFTDMTDYMKLIGLNEAT